MPWSGLTQLGPKIHFIWGKKVLLSDEAFQSAITAQSSKNDCRSGFGLQSFIFYTNAAEIYIGTVFESPGETKKTWRRQDAVFLVLFFLSWAHRQQVKGNGKAFWVTCGSFQGLAGALGEGQEPWLSKLAVLVFHWKRENRHKMQQRFEIQNCGNKWSAFL